MRTIEMSEIWPDIYDKGYIHQFQPSSPGLSISTPIGELVLMMDVKVFKDKHIIIWVDGKT